MPDHREQTQLKVGADYKSNALTPGHATMKKIDQFVSSEMVVMFIHADTIIGPPGISGKQYNIFYQLVLEMNNK